MTKNLSFGLAASWAWCASLLLATTSAAGAAAQLSQASVRFYGTGVAPPGQQDRILLPIDDNLPGAGGSTAMDLGAGDFTLELWVRGRLVDNATANAGGDIEFADYSWIDGNIVLDRDIWCGSERKFGVSLAGGLVRFGTAPGDSGGPDGWNTIEGSTPVLDDTWHHVAVVRQVASGRKRIYVDGALDFESAAGASTADLSYPDAGIAVTPGLCNPGQLTAYGWYLVVAAEKHDAGAAYPSFNGLVDELRAWSAARTAEQLAATYRRVLNPASPGLAGAYRFEEGSGTAVASSSLAAAPTGSLVAGTVGNGEWMSRADDSANTAPLMDMPFADGFELGEIELWTVVVGATTQPAAISSDESPSQSRRHGLADMQR